MKKEIDFMARIKFYGNCHRPNGSWTHSANAVERAPAINNMYGSVRNGRMLIERVFWATVVSQSVKRTVCSYFEKGLKDKQVTGPLRFLSPVYLKFH